MSNFKGKLYRCRNTLNTTYYSSLNDTPEYILLIIKILINVLNSILEFLDDKEKDNEV